MWGYKAQYLFGSKTGFSLPKPSPKSMEDLDPVVQSIVSLTSSLRGQLVKCFMTLLQNTMIFLLKKMREAFAMQKLLTFLQQKILANLYV